MAAGGFAFGWLGLGGIVYAVYGAGGVVAASQIALGGVAEAPLAIGRAVQGQTAIQLPEAGPLSPETREMIRQALAEALGGRHRWLEALLRALCGG